jgi:hypothetical protein
MVEDKTTMNYYVRRDRENRKVSVHVGSCIHCKEGKGKHQPSITNSTWYGPYDTLEAAKQFAKTLGTKDTRTCAVCLDGKRF